MGDHGNRIGSKCSDKECNAKNINTKQGTEKKSYSVVVKNETESVIIIKPKDDEEKSSEVTKKDIKNKIHVSRLGVGITKIKKITRGDVVVGCENKQQADKLKEEVTKDLKVKYSIQAPKQKKLKVKIFDIDKKDSEDKGFLGKDTRTEWDQERKF